ncbi:unnamed protein product [Protopolystoma xenopodis]|uniref:PDZ domain-containing protein n=1 Tax=Protopolystoma xenopodis TaxID=117903 RepID=A0A448WY50_9PLAT|nr:unnamed protein product [Protopolystoma xenopodis]
MMAAAAAASSASSGHFSQPVPGPPPSTQQIRLNIQIERQPEASLGLTIAGGYSSAPFRGNDLGIFISRLTETGLAYAAGLRLGDKILKVI